MSSEKMSIEMNGKVNGEFVSVVCGQREIPFELLRSERKTMEISVWPDKSVVVKAPLKSDLDEITKRVRKRAEWILRQIRFFEQFEPRTPPRRYVGGEDHLYLGRRYRLKINRSPDLKRGSNGQGVRNGVGDGRVLLKNGYFFVDSLDSSPENIQQLLESWYLEKAKGCFEKIFEQCWADFQNRQASLNGKTSQNSKPSPSDRAINAVANENHPLSKPSLKIRKMKTRWGSMSPKGNMSLNLELIKTPKECIEYVVIHELCHLLHNNHSPSFYKLLESSLPDWSTRKHKLELTLA